MRWVGALVVLFAGACTCRDQSLISLTDQLHAPGGLDCGRVRAGTSRAMRGQIDNVGRTSVDAVVWDAGSPFTVTLGPGRLDPGPSDFEVTCTPPDAGDFEGVLTLTARGETLRIGLSVEGFVPPVCPQTEPCVRSEWSDDAGSCVTGPAPDGTACPSDDQCLVGAICVSGRCTGQPRDCDDHDACTDDACSKDTGCVHVAKVCAGDGVCQVGVCDPTNGCGLGPANDGIPCGPLRTCVAAQVCVGGACVVRHPPADFVCAEKSPCQPEGRCQNEQCMQAPATVLEPSLSIGAPQPDGGPPEAWSDLIVNAYGDATLSSYFLSPPRMAVQGAPVSLPMSARRCIAWGANLACADYPNTVVAGVSLIDGATGGTKWTYSGVAHELPYFAGPSVEVFLARLALVSDSVLAAVFESRTPDPTTGADTRCRRFGVVMLDAQGGVVAQTMIDHPMFEVCTHPHSYGVAADQTGNLYFAFSPSDVDNPATAIQGTTLFGYRSDLSLKWTAVAPQLVGGEIAVARGRLLHERSNTVWDTATGNSIGLLPVPFGFGVIARDFILPAPQSGSSDVMAVDLQTLAVRWTQPLGFLAGGPVHLATMDTSFGARTVALAFTGDGGARELAATDVATGERYFSCPIDLPERPVQSALVPQRLFVMSGPRSLSPGVPECDQCDPRWARTRNTFRVWAVPGLAPAAAPWPGAWGGVNHDHREDVVP